LLNAAGYGDGLKATTLVSNVPGYVCTAEALQNQFSDVGIDREIKPVPSPQVPEEFALSKNVEANTNPEQDLANPDGIV